MSSSLQRDSLLRRSAGSQILTLLVILRFILVRFLLLNPANSLPPTKAASVRPLLQLVILRHLVILLQLVILRHLVILLQSPFPLCRQKLILAAPGSPSSHGVVRTEAGMDLLMLLATLVKTLRLLML